MSCVVNIDPVNSDRLYEFNWRDFEEHSRLGISTSSWYIIYIPRQKVNSGERFVF